MKHDKAKLQQQLQRIPNTPENAAVRAMLQRQLVEAEQQEQTEPAAILARLEAIEARLTALEQG